MSPVVRKIFLQFMPKLLIMQRTTYTLPEYDDSLPPRGYSNEMELHLREPFTTDFKLRDPCFLFYDDEKMKAHSSSKHPHVFSHVTPRTLSAGVLSALQGVRFIAQHIRDADKDNEIVEDWKFVSMVLDRFFLWVFTLACIGGTFGIILQAPSLYDTRVPVHQQLSDIPITKIYQMPPSHTHIPIH